MRTAEPIVWYACCKWTSEFANIDTYYFFFNVLFVANHTTSLFDKYCSCQMIHKNWIIQDQYNKILFFLHIYLQWSKYWYGQMIEQSKYYIFTRKQDGSRSITIKLKFIQKFESIKISILFRALPSHGSTRRQIQNKYCNGKLFSWNIFYDIK